MRATSWILSFALLLVLLDAGWERTRRRDAGERTPVVDSGDAHALDGNDGQPPPPKP